ncbi:NAD kinase 2, mitochondrial [Tribolium madens]|uniref:NAD kinase 2, mitochondrial n=1 Tax=Tribolium madens TaxID=41895 RepID=UPI001CF763A6|nr:NAD kinase 2, mitochondrial [Tribolium madens]
MFKPRTSFKDIILGIKNVATTSEPPSKNSIKIDKVLVLSKLSRYEFEKKQSNLSTDADFEQELRSRGTDFEWLIHCHMLHKKFESNVVNTFRKMGIDVEVANRFNYTQEKVDWADVIVPTGGDGTFLLASSRIRDSTKPVIGLNSDPNRSEGHLCLPKKYSGDVRSAVEKLRSGEFDWLLRSRIRVKLISQKGDIVPKCLHEIEDNFGKIQGKILPVLALNEVFVGESISSRVSHLQMRLNGSVEQTGIKCSGVCVCTGTGSTSWHLSINRLPVQSVAELLKLVEVKSGEERDVLAAKIADCYNKNLVFRPDDTRMCYTIRDLISAGVWPYPKGIKSRDFITKLEIKSNCYKASLVIDGGVSFDFNDGTIAFLEIRPEDSLRTVILRP